MGLAKLKGRSAPGSPHSSYATVSAGNEVKVFAGVSCPTCYELKKRYEFQRKQKIWKCF